MSSPPFRLVNRSFTIFGARFPAPAFLLSVGTLAASTLAAVGYRLGWPFVTLMTLEPALVWRGQVWRLLTWPLFELDPISLIFACLILLFFGRDLSYQWGPARFFRVYLGFTLATGAAVCLVGLVWPAVWQGRYLTAWPMADALIIAWATAFPSRQLLVYFVLPLGGRKLVYATIGINVLFALFNGLSLYVPHFVALGGMLAYQRGGLRGLWGRWRRGGWGTGGTRRRSSLRVIDPRERRDEPPRWLH